MERNPAQTKLGNCSRFAYKQQETVERQAVGSPKGSKLELAIAIVFRFPAAGGPEVLFWSVCLYATQKTAATLISMFELELQTHFFV